jgi:hypothetical protein
MGAGGVVDPGPGKLGALPFMCALHTAEYTPQKKLRKLGLTGCVSDLAFLVLDATMTCPREVQPGRSRVGQLADQGWVIFFTINTTYIDSNK